MRDFAEHLNLKDLGLQTIKSYYRDMRLVSEHFGQNPKYLTQKQLREYILYVKEEKEWAPKTIRQTIASARAFYADMLGKNWKPWDIVTIKDRETLPVVLDIDEATALFHQMPLLRYKIPLLLIYNCGLRLKECQRLTVHDIDGPNNRLIIRQGKGRKDRYVPLSSAMYRQLQKYWTVHKNKTYLFPATGRGPRQTLIQRMHQADEHMHENALSKTLREACKNARIQKKVTIHTLRHSYATHLHAMGVSIRQLQIYLGHSTIETTTLYTHLVPFSEEKSLKLIDELANLTL